MSYKYSRDNSINYQSLTIYLDAALQYINK